MCSKKFRELLLFGMIIPLFLQGCWGQEEWNMVWNDEFDGTSVDTAKWSFQTGNGQPELPGWGNNELQYYMKENFSVDNGLLILSVKKEKFSEYVYTSGRMRSIHKGDWIFGKIEARIKLPRGKGIWPAFWMMPTDNVYGVWPQSGEIDIMEMLGNEPRKIYGTVHYGPKWPKNKHSGFFLESDSDYSSAFHVYSIEWLPGSIEWFIDYKSFFKVTRLDLTTDHWPFDERFHIILNCAVGGNWPGNPDSTTILPQTMQVDWIRVYQENKYKESLIPKK